MSKHKKMPITVADLMERLRTLCQDRPDLLHSYVRCQDQDTGMPLNVIGIETDAHQRVWIDTTGYGDTAEID